MRHGQTLQNSKLGEISYPCCHCEVLGRVNVADYEPPHLWQPDTCANPRFRAEIVRKVIIYKHDDEARRRGRVTIYRGFPKLDVAE